MILLFRLCIIFINLWLLNDLFFKWCIFLIHTKLDLILLLRLFIIIVNLWLLNNFLY